MGTDGGAGFGIHEGQQRVCGDDEYASVKKD